MPPLPPPGGSRHLAELEHDGCETGRLWMSLSERPDAPLGGIETHSIVVVADHPHRRDRLRRVAREDDPTIPVADNELSPAGEAPSEGPAGVLTNFLQPD